MTDQTETRVFLKSPGGSPGFGLFTADVSDSDTVTLDDFDKLIAISVLKVADGSAVTSAVDGTTLNKINIDAAAGTVSDRVLIFAYGT